MGAGVERPCETLDPCPHTSGSLAAHGPINNWAKDPGSLPLSAPGSADLGPPPAKPLAFGLRGQLQRYSAQYKQSMLTGKYTQTP
jgi:hypothetical protein